LNTTKSINDFHGREIRNQKKECIKIIQLDSLAEGNLFYLGKITQCHYHMPENSNDNNIRSSYSLVTIAVMTIIVTPLILLLLFSSLLYQNAIITLAAVYGQSSGGNDSSPMMMIHGGGIGSISCPDGSSKQAVISFVLSKNSSNGKVISSNWNINEIPSGQNPNPGFLNGSFNSVNLNSGKYIITGQKMSEAHFCVPPVSAPITISGPCSQNVPIIVKFQSGNPILTAGGSFKGDVAC
jgi:hypothetical protein